MEILSLFSGISIGKYYIYASNSKGGHNWPLTPAEVLTNFERSIIRIFLNLQNQVAVEKIGRNGFSKELIG